MIVLVFTWIYVIAAVLLLFGAAIFLHELGHYLVARWCGLKVEAFAIGFGPKIFGWTKNGIEYSWRLIPAGGYVKLPQMVTSEALEGSSAGEKLPPASPVAKILVAIAGPIMNVIFGFVLAWVLSIVGLPVLVNPSTVGYVDPASVEAKMGVQRGDRIVEVNGRKTSSWQDVQMATVLAQTNIVPVVMERAGQRHTFHLPTVTSELIGGKFLRLDPDDHPQIREVSAGGAAEKAGLNAGDIILNYSGVPIYGQEQLVKLIQKSGGKATEMQIQRGDTKMTITATPNLDPDSGKGKLGIAMGSSALNVYEVQYPTAMEQIKQVWGRLADTISALWHSEKTGVGAKDLSGPIGILGMLGSFVNTDYRLALSFLVLLNINLAILNMLPVPVLDGGHVVMATIEGIIRRPIPPRIVEFATTAFAILLIGFMLFVSFYDVKRFGLFRMMFKQKNQIEETSKPAAGSGQGAAPANAPEPAATPAPAPEPAR
ncbi:MAG: RIP metalloprotease RseP [Verrucomicrobiales bacterium]